MNEAQRIVTFWAIWFFGTLIGAGWYLQNHAVLGSELLSKILFFSLLGFNVLMTVKPFYDSIVEMEKKMKEVEQDQYRIKDQEDPNYKRPLPEKIGFE